MSKKALWAQVLTFLIFVGAFFAINLLTPERGFSEQENRTLQTRPKFTLSALFSGSFSSQYEDYVTDQFALRDDWISLKARLELLSGKGKNNGIYLCENETLIEGFSAPDESSLGEKLDSLNELCQNTDADVYFALIPSAAEIWRGKLPSGAENDSQRELIDAAYAAADAETVDIYSSLAAHSAENIFYRTDHHWTTLGAYYGYCALADAMGFSPVSLSEYTPTVVTDEFFGTTWSSSGFSWVSPDSITTYVEQGNVKITNYPYGSPEQGQLYDSEYLSKKDKYSYFYGGNTPLLETDTGSEGESLLIIRDSYMDSLSPYLFPHFSHISILDLRYYKTSLADFIAQNSFDSILVCYSVPNFSTDMNLFLLGL